MSAGIKIGDTITVVDQTVASYPMTGKVVELDPHPFREQFARIEIEGGVLGPLSVWVNIRLAKKIK